MHNGRMAAVAYAIWRVVAAIIVGPILMMAEFWIAVIVRWKWLFALATYPAATVQKWLESRGVLSPQTGGHMPDFSFIFGFNSAINIAALLILMFCYPNLLSGFFTPRREHA